MDRNTKVLEECRDELRFVRIERDRNEVEVWGGLMAGALAFVMACASGCASLDRAYNREVVRKLDERFPELFGFNFWSDAGFYNVVGNQNGQELMTDSRIVTLDSKDKLKRPAPRQK